jgi:hypothetical protein
MGDAGRRSLGHLSQAPASPIPERAVVDGSTRVAGRNRPWGGQWRLLGPLPPAFGPPHAHLWRRLRHVIAEVAAGRHPGDGLVLL